MPKSQNEAPINCYTKGILKRRLKKRKIFIMAGFKNASKDKWNKLEQSCINRTLEN